MARVAKNICEIDFEDSQWMRELGELSRSAEMIVLRNFCPTASSLSFIRNISWKNHLVMSSVGDDVIFQKPVRR